MFYYPPYQPPPDGPPLGPGTPNPGGLAYAPGHHHHQLQQIPYFPPPPGVPQAAQYPAPPPPPPLPPRPPVLSADTGPPIPARPPGYGSSQLPTYMSPPQEGTPQSQWTSSIIAGRQYQAHFAPPPKSPTSPPQLPPRPGSAAPPPVAAPQGYYTPSRQQAYPPQALPPAPLSAHAPSLYQGAPPAGYTLSTQQTQHHQAQPGPPPQNDYRPSPQASASYAANPSGYQASPPPPLDVEGLSNMMQSVNVGSGSGLTAATQISQQPVHEQSANEARPNHPGVGFPTPPTTTPSSTGPGQGHHRYNQPPPPPSQEHHQGAQYQSTPPSSHPTHQEAQDQQAPPPLPPPQTNRYSPSTPAHRDIPQQNQARINTQLARRNWSERYMKHGIKTAPICVDTLMDIRMTWYTHPSAPTAYICSRCYVDHIYPTSFKDDFKGELQSEGQPRVCRFSKLRASEYLFPQANATGHLQPLLDFMNARLKISDCKGLSGAKGEDGIKFWMAKNEAIPGLVICEACMEDVVKTSHFLSKFEPATNHGARDVWTCDLAGAYVYNEFKEASNMDDWSRFTKNAMTRLYLAPCPGAQQIECADRKFYTLQQGPQTFCICEVCYYDKVLGGGVPGQEAHWSRSITYATASCDMVDFNILMPMLLTLEIRDPSIFLATLPKVLSEPHCDAKGTKTENWYTLTADPDDFGVCGACYHGVVEPYGLAKFFKRKRGADAGTPLLCSLSAGHLRFRGMAQRLLHTLYLDDATDWAAFAAKYAGVAACPRNKPFKDGVWYGWNMCTICPECYVEFAEGTALDPQMTLRRTRREAITMCEMYSPRMRRLYADACEGRIEGNELLALADARRTVYTQTIMQCERILSQQRIALMRQQQLNAQSSFYTNLGRMQVASIGSSYTYGQAGLGYGFQSQAELDGARYGRQAMEVGVAATSGSALIQIQEFERQWAEVE